MSTKTERKKKSERPKRDRNKMGTPLRSAQSDFQLGSKKTRSVKRQDARKKRPEDQRTRKEGRKDSEEEREEPSKYEKIKGEKPKEWAARIEGQGPAGLKAEFLDLKQSNCSSEAFENNPAKNRYRDVKCYDHSRVKLENCQEGDYIHANYVDGYKRRKRFICTQGPLEGTVEDFWRMVWQENTAVVVMLTKLVELERTKCASYFEEEEGKKMQRGDFIILTGTVTHEYISETEKLIARDILLRHKGSQREIKHLHYVDWPDRGVPAAAGLFISLVSHIHLNQVRQARKNNLDPNKSPTVIHCSAGIGRTGTLVAVDVCQEHLRKTGRINVKEVVEKIREQRAHSVQVDAQYIFIHRAIIEWSILTNRIKFNYTNFFADQKP